MSSSSDTLISDPVSAKKFDADDEQELTYYPTSFIPKGAKVIRLGPLKSFTMEFAGVFLLMFFGILATVELNLLPVVVQSQAISQFSANITGGSVSWSNVPDATQFSNQINGLQVISANATTFRNPAALFTTAAMWAALFFIIVRALPGVALIPWVNIYNLLFAYPSNDYKFEDSNAKQAFMSTIYAKTVLRTILAVAGQFLGGLLGSVAVYFVQGRDVDRIAETLPSSRIKETDIIAYEFAAAFVFMAMINCFSAPRKTTPTQQAGYIAFTVFVLFLAFGDLTGCGLTWVRTFGPAMIRAMAGHGWRVSTAYYLVGQVIGFFSVGFISWFMRISTKED